MRKRSLSKSKRRRMRSKRKRRSKRKYDRKSIKRDGMIIKDSTTGLGTRDDGDEKTSKIFRKYFNIDSKGDLTERGENELAVVKKLKQIYDKDDKEYNENLIIIRRINTEEKYYETDFVDSYTELCNKNNTKKDNIREQLIKLNKTRSYLLDNGIAYIDWKIDNTGIKDGKIILFDFDASGIFNTLKKDWINKPVLSENFKYVSLIFNTYRCLNTNPRFLDTFLFRNMMYNENSIIDF